MCQRPQGSLWQSHSDAAGDDALEEPYGHVSPQTFVLRVAAPCSSAMSLPAVPFERIRTFFRWSNASASLSGLVELHKRSHRISGYRSSMPAYAVCKKHDTEFLCDAAGCSLPRTSARHSRSCAVRRSIAPCLQRCCSQREFCFVMHVMPT